MSVDMYELFKTEYDTEPDAVCSAPGVLHLLGEHTEFARGHVLSLALPLRATIAVSRRTDTSIRIHAANYDERKRSSISNLKFKKEDRWANLIKGVLAGLDTLGCTLSGVNVIIYSDVPDGRGLGASSAICLAATLAFCRLFHFSITEAQTVYVAHTAETQFMDRPSRVSTCYTSLHAHAGALFSIDLRTLDYRFLRLTASDIHFYLIDSLVPPVGAAEEHMERQHNYTEVRARLKPLIGKRDIRDISPRELKDLVSSQPESLRRVCMHVATEEARHHQAVDSIESAQVSALGKILHRSHDSLRDLYEISCPELDWLVKHDVSLPGSLGTRLSGKGFGACAIMLIQGEIEAIDHSFVKYLAEYERIFGFAGKVRRIVVSEGASDLTMAGAST